MKRSVAMSALLSDIVRPLPRRLHKHQRGHVLVIAGSKNMSGAGLLVGRGAMRMGAGLVTLAYPAGLADVYRRAFVEALHLMVPQTAAGSLASAGYRTIMSAAAAVEAVALGPGLTRNKKTESVVIRLVDNINKPLVVDADGLNAIADSGRVETIFKKRKSQAPLVLTPHEGEMARLIGKSTAFIASHRQTVACMCAARWNCVVILKGYHSIIAAPDGKVSVNRSGGPALATAGSGDILTGMVATMLAQHPDRPFAAAAVAVYIHGLAGDAAAQELGERSVIALDVLASIPAVLKRLARA